MSHPIHDGSNFIDSDIQERDVTLGDGKVHKLRFKRLPGVEYYAFSIAQQSKDDDQRIRSIARLVSVSLVDDAGERVLTVDQAASLKDGVLSSLLAAANDVNQGGEKKTSAPVVTDTSGI